MQNRQEFQCKDCGHKYFFAEGQYSSICLHCGNIAYHGIGAEKSRFESTALLGQTVMKRLSEVNEKDIDWQISQDSVETIISRFQVEWQLWAQVVLHFNEPAYHMAYITHISTNRIFDIATSRYATHRANSLPIQGLKWEAEMADSMIHRIESLLLGQFIREERPKSLHWIVELPWEKQFFQVGVYLIVATVLGPLFFKLINAIAK